MAKAKETILAIYEEKKRKTTTVSIEVKKSQHKYVIGPRGGTLQEILALTGKEMFEECFGIFLLWWDGGRGGEGWDRGREPRSNWRWEKRGWEARFPNWWEPGKMENFAIEKAQRGGNHNGTSTPGTGSTKYGK